MVLRRPGRSCRWLSLPACGVLLGLVACATASSGTLGEAPCLHPTLAQPVRPLAALCAFPPPGRSETPPKRAPASRSDRTVSPAPRRPVASLAPPESPDLLGDVDLRRREVVRSAQRVLGVTGSFDNRSFLGHILRVNDLLPDGERAETFSAMQFKRWAESRKRLVSAGSALPGDIVLFPCDGGCGVAAQDGLAAGVVVRTYEDRLEFVSYVDSRVRACHAGGTRPRLPSRQVRDAVAVVSIAPRPASAEAPPR